MAYSTGAVVVTTLNSPVTITRLDTGCILSDSTTHTVDATGDTVVVEVLTAGATLPQEVLQLTNGIDNVYAAGVLGIRLTVVSGSATVAINGA